MITIRTTVNGRIVWRSSHLGTVAYGRTRKQAERNLARGYGFNAASAFLRVAEAGRRLAQALPAAGDAMAAMGRMMGRMAKEAQA